MAIYWDVCKVNVVGDHTLRVLFFDGLEGIVKFLPNFFRGVFSHLVHPDEFKQVTIVDGAVTWSGHLDLAPDAMHHHIKTNHGEWVVED